MRSHRSEMKDSVVPCKRFRPTILPDFNPSGLLELESNNKQGILLKHVEPQDACAPNEFYANIRAVDRPVYKLMVYRGDLLEQEFDLMDKSSHVVGRASGETVLADVPLEEETCSKQHCVIQFRKQDGCLKIYVLDLESVNGTTLNGDEIPSSRYIELRSGDVISSVESVYDIVFMNSNLS